MEFGLSEEQILLQDSLNRFLDAQVSLDRVRQFAETPAADEIWQGLAELGITGILTPEIVTALVGLSLLSLLPVAHKAVAARRA